MPWRGPDWPDIKIILCIALLLVQPTRARDWTQKQADKDDVAGPVVRAQLEKAVKALASPPSGILADANSTEEKKKTIAQILDEALEHEFPEAKEEGVGKNYNESAKLEDATVETVIKVSQNKRPEPEPEEVASPPPAVEQSPAVHSIIHHSWGHVGQRDGGPAKVHVAPAPSPLAKAAAGKSKQRDHLDNVEKEVDRIIDSQDNEYVLSKPKDGVMGLTLDPQLIRDLTVLITSSTLGGMLMESLKQPVINGYFIAGSVVGPGGFKLIKELVQVESLAQVGVQLLLFTLGLEFSLSKLRAVRSVALLGGMCEIMLFILVAGGAAHVIGASVHEGIFVGALVSMSSTSIVVKCLADTKGTASPHGQITIGTLILQDCMVGLLFAFMPVLANNRSGGSVDHFQAARLLFRVAVTLGTGLAMALLVARTALPPLMRLLAKAASAELYQLTIFAFCLMAGWLSGYMGLSTELGAFIAGVMLSATEQQEHALAQLEPLKQFFMSLFISSTGLVMSPTFLAQHLRVLAAGLLLTVLSKTILISSVVWMFKYPVRTAVAVGMGMAQIGEFAFVLLSVASQLGLLPYQVYMLLMGITALSLLVTPFLLQGSQKILADGDPGPLLVWPQKARSRRNLSDDLGALGTGGDADSQKNREAAMEAGEDAALLERHTPTLSGAHLQPAHQRTGGGSSGAAGPQPQTLPMAQASLQQRNPFL